MSERKVLTKYYPPDFDPSAIGRRRGPKQVGPKVQTVRLMAPFSMMCLKCSEFIYKGRKFNARKETPPDLRYLDIQIFRFYIRCTRCSSEIIFRTDPKNNNYAVVSGAKRNVEPWARGNPDETDEQALDRVEAWEGIAAEEEEKNVMADLEAKTLDARREMDVADALDEIRTRNARIQRADRDGVEVALARPADEEAERQEREDEEEARRAFAAAASIAAVGEAEQSGGEEGGADVNGAAFDGDVSQKVSTGDETNGATASTESARAASASMPPPPPPSFKRQVKKKVERGALLGIKKKVALM